MGGRLWFRLIKQHRIWKQETVPCLFEEAQEALCAACKEADVPVPMWLPKHGREWEDFRRTAFTQDHFVEEIRFDRMEIEFLEEGDTRRRSRDPRNDFDD